MKHMGAVLAVSALAFCAGAQDLPQLKTETVAAPSVTARLFSSGLAPNTRGGWTWVGQYMNYKPTGDKEKETVQLPTGEHYLAYKDTKARPEAEWVLADLEKGTSKVIRLPGFNSSIPPALAGNGRLFFSVDYAQLYYYEPAEDTVKPLGRMHDNINEYRTSYRLLVGPDGMIYGTAQATNGFTTLMRLNPDTLQYKLWDRIGLPGRRAGLTYGYELAVDPPWAYIAVGQGNWELFAVNMETGEKKCLADVQGDGCRVTVNRGADICSAVASTKGGFTRYWLVDGQAIAGEKPQIPPLSQKKYPMVEWKHSKPMDISKPPTVSKEDGVVLGDNGQGEVFWRPAGADPAEAPKSVKFTLQNTEAVRIESLIALPDGSILGNTEQYRGFFRYYPATKKLEAFGPHGPSGVRSVFYEGKVWFDGYPNTNLSAYDPTQPWTSKKAEALPKGAPAVNPTFIGYFGQGTTEAHHCRFLLAPGNGRIYICGDRERWSTGTGLGYYDIASGRKFGLGQANKEIYPVGFIALPKLGRLVLSGRGTQPVKLIVYDMDLTEVDRIELKPGLKNTGALFATDADSRFIGCYEDPETQSFVLYLYDLAEKKVVKQAAAPGMLHLFRRPADGTTWAIRGATLSTLNPQTLETKDVGELDRAIRQPVWTGKLLFGAAGGELVQVALP